MLYVCPECSTVTRQVWHFKPVPQIPVGDYEITILVRLLKRVFTMDMGRCPVCQQGTLRIIAAITQGSVIRKILRHLKLAVDPPPIAPARQAAFDWVASSP